MKVYGLTGGIGSGKSYVAKLVTDNFDILHIDTDSIARRQMMPGGASYDAVVAEFGEGILAADKTIDRGVLAGIVFNDKDKLARLNAITHPNVTKNVKAIFEASEEVFAGVLVETAILKEAGYESMCDEIWYVRAPLSDRIGRLKRDRGMSEEKAAQTIASQADEETFLSYATAVIDNPDGMKPEDIIARIAELTGLAPGEADIDDESAEVDV